MSFLQLGAGTVGLLLFFTISLTVFLYWLKPPPQRVVVPSMFIWSRVLKERKRRSDFWRWLVSLLIALAVGVAVTTAVGRPEVASLTDGARRVAVILDNSPTMGARTGSGATRWELARDRGRALLRAGGSGTEYLVADTAGHLPRTEFGSRRTALERLEGLELALREADVLGVAGIPEAGADTSVYVVTDGVLVRELPPEATVVSVYEPVPNVGITAFDLRAVPAEATRFEAYVELLNHSGEPEDVLLQLDGVAGVTLQRRVALEPGETLGQILSLEEFPAGPVRALIDAPGDGYELDDVAYAFLGTPRRLRGVLVTPGNSYLETVLGLDPRLALDVVTPEGYARAEPPDLYVLDRFAPSVAPRAPALVFDPPPVDWLPRPTGRVLEGLSLQGTESEHPLMEHVSLADVVAERAKTVEAGEHDVVVGTELEPIVVAGQTPVRWALVSFDLTASSFPLHSAFPVFLQNAVSWLTGTEVLTTSLGTVAVPIASGGVTDLEGREVRSRVTETGTSFAPSAPGLYSVRGRGREVVVSANLLSPTVSAINDSIFAAAGTSEPAASAREVSGGMGELWVVLLLFALALVLAEWWTYHRRMTV